MLGLVCFHGTDESLARVRACGADGCVVFEHIGASCKNQNSSHWRAYGGRDNKVGGNGVSLAKCKTCYLGKQN